MGIGGVGMRRAIGCLGGVEIGPMFFSHSALLPSLRIGSLFILVFLDN